MKKLLYVGDSPEVPSGFGRATRELLERIRHHYDVTVLGINHLGDPGTVPNPAYTAAAGGDAFGIKRFVWMCDKVRPDVIVIQQDGFWFPYYVAALRKRTSTYEYQMPEHAAVPIIGSAAIDGKNFDGEWIEAVTKAVFWTDFAYHEARAGGFVGEASVIPLGVDLETFYPVEREGALERQKVTPLRDLFVVGNVNRNQPRKRWDLTLKYFAEWVHTYRVSDARLFLHSAPTGDQSINVAFLAKYYGILDKVVLYEPEPFYGKADDDMRDTYNCFDVMITTTQGEGMGLTTMEAMACGVPCIVPDWAALGDWAAGAAAMVPCTSTAPQTFSATVNVIGGVLDEKAYIAALDALYREKQHRELIGSLGLARVSDARFRWDTIANQWLTVLDSLFTPPAPIVTGEDLAGLEVMSIAADAGRMIAKLQKFAAQFPDEVAVALFQEAQIEATEMKKRTPVDTTPKAPHPGNLRNSIHVLRPERRGRIISVTIATGAQAPYAIYVHENPDAYHPVGQWKFMESVLNESRPYMGARLAARLQLKGKTL